MGLPGYYIFNAAVIITLVGASTGTMVNLVFSCLSYQIAMTDFITAIPIQIGSERMHRFLCQLILTIIVLILTLLKDPSYYSLYLTHHQSSCRCFFFWYDCNGCQSYHSLYLWFIYHFLHFQERISLPYQFRRLFRKPWLVCTFTCLYLIPSLSNSILFNAY